MSLTLQSDYGRWALTWDWSDVREHGWFKRAIFDYGDERPRCHYWRAGPLAFFWDEPETGEMRAAQMEAFNETCAATSLAQEIIARNKDAKRRGFH